MKRTVAFVALFLAGFVVFAGGYWTSYFPAPQAVVRVGIPVVALLATLALRRRHRTDPWFRVSVALLVASLAFTVVWLTSGPLLSWVGAKPDSVRGIALVKLFDALLITATVLAGARLAGLELHELFLRSGRTRLWVVAGGVSFLVLALLFVLQATSQGVPPERIVSWAPWTLLFVFANGMMEELHFRGLLLAPFEKLLGPTGANACIAAFFAILHGPVKYTPDVVVFVAVVFGLALAWGYLIQKSRALWGSVLFHAGADLLIIVGIYRTFGAL